MSHTLAFIAAAVSCALAAAWIDKALGHPRRSPLVAVVHDAMWACIGVAMWSVVR